MEVDFDNIWNEDELLLLDLLLEDENMSAAASGTGDWGLFGYDENMSAAASVPGVTGTGDWGLFGNENMSAAASVTDDSDENMSNDDSDENMNAAASVPDLFGNDENMSAAASVPGDSDENMSDDDSDENTSAAASVNMNLSSSSSADMRNYYKLGVTTNSWSYAQHWDDMIKRKINKLYHNKRGNVGYSTTHNIGDWITRILLPKISGDTKVVLCYNNCHGDDVTTRDILGPYEKIKYINISPFGKCTYTLNTANTFLNFIDNKIAHMRFTTIPKNLASTLRDDLTVSANSADASHFKDHAVLKMLQKANPKHLLNSPIQIPRRNYYGSRYGGIDPSFIVFAYLNMGGEWEYSIYIAYEEFKTTLEEILQPFVTNDISLTMYDGSCSESPNKISKEFKPLASGLYGSDSYDYEKGGKTNKSNKSNKKNKKN